MSRRYELTDQDWEQIASLLPPEKTGKPGRPSKDNRTMLNGMVWIARSGAPWRDLPERYGPWNSVYSLSLIHISMTLFTLCFITISVPSASLF